jgi:hypothetical protein
MHVAGADRSDQRIATTRAQRKNDEHMPPFGRYHDRLESLLGSRVRRVRDHCDRPLECALDRDDRHPMLLTLVAIAVIPIETGDARVHS